MKKVVLGAGKESKPSQQLTAVPTLTPGGGRRGSDMGAQWQADDPINASTARRCAP